MTVHTRATFRLPPRRLLDVNVCVYMYMRDISLGNIYRAFYHRPAYNFVIALKHTPHIRGTHLALVLTLLVIKAASGAPLRSNCARQKLYSTSFARWTLLIGGINGHCAHRSKLRWYTEEYKPKRIQLSEYEDIVVFASFSSWITSGGHCRAAPKYCITI